MTTLDSSQWMYSSASGFYSHNINQSLRFEDGDSAYLTRTFGSASNQRTWTWSAWIKRGNLGGSVVRLFNANDGGSPYRQTSLRFDSDQLRFYNDAPSGVVTDVKSSAVFRDVSAWYNIVLAIDTTSGTSSNRVKIYVNGSQITNLATSTYPTQNLDMYVNAARSHQIGASVTPSQHFDGYMAEVNFIDGSQLDPTSFGETKAGIWIPKDTSGLTFGTNGFRLKFQDSSALGDDTSGNGNDFSSSGLASTDVVLDSPTNNWCTINPLSSRGTQSEGNLKTVTEASGYSSTVGSMGHTTGKWYWEVVPTSAVSGGPYIGVVDETYDSTNSGSAVGYLLGNDGVDSIAYYFNGNKYINGTGSSYGASYTTDDIIGVALNLDDNEITFYKNGASQGTISHTFSGNHILPAVSDGSNTSSTITFIFNFGQDGSFAGTNTAQGNTDGNGKGDFYYSPPSGFLALCTANLPNPGIDPAQDEEPADYFNTVLWTGNDVNDRAVTGVGFQPSWVWIKNRAVAEVHNLYDVIRGAGQQLYSDSTDAEFDRGIYGLKSFTSDGFTLGTGGEVNDTGETYVAWNWLAGGSASSNSNGSITSSVSANTEAGFSIVSYTGNGTAGATVGHGLASTPEFFITKRRSQTDPWQTYVASLGATKRIELNATSGAITSTASFNDTEPNSSVFTLGSGGYGNASSATYIAYCFHSVDGYSRVGTYTGNGSTDGPFVYTGHRVAWLLVKRTSAVEDWHIYDNTRSPENVMKKVLFPNLSDAEATYSSGNVDFLSNGFKWRNTGGSYNASGSTYIYLAFAEQPFKYSNAR